MAIHREMIVDIPEHSYLQRKGGREYVYMYTKFFRRPDGRPSNRSMAVGMLTSGDDWVMHPNDNYLRMHHITIDQDALAVKAMGKKAKTAAIAAKKTAGKKAPGKKKPKVGVKVSAKETPEKKEPRVEIKMALGE